jgi:hypothetical protein
MAKYHGTAVGLMRGKRVVVTLVFVFLAILFAAWFDGGEEPVRPIEQKIALPEGDR